MQVMAAAIVSTPLVLHHPILEGQICIFSGSMIHDPVLITNYFLQSQMQVMAAELVARAGEVDRLRTDLETMQAESRNLRSEVAQLSQRADETQKKLNSEVKPATLESGCIWQCLLLDVKESLHWLSGMITIAQAHL